MKKQLNHGIVDFFRPLFHVFLKILSFVFMVCVFSCAVQAVEGENVIIFLMMVGVILVLMDFIVS